jgi:peptidoglycan/xylan/chitin deacetylase (PgdA/CDA1 family)
MGIIKAMPFKVSLTKLSVLIAFAISSSLGLAQESHCKKTVYLTFDTGNMSVAQNVADILNRQKIQATFFLANEKTSRGDFSLDDSWKSYWQERVREGHHFGSHTFARCGCNS